MNSNEVYNGKFKNVHVWKDFLNKNIVNACTKYVVHSSMFLF